MADNYIALVMAAVSLVFSVLALLLVAGLSLRQERLSKVASLLRGTQVGLVAGQRAPTEVLEELVGERSLVDRWSRGPTLLAFVAQSCSSCHTLLTNLNEVLVGESSIDAVVVEEPEGKATQPRHSLRELATFDATWLWDGAGAALRAFATEVTPHTFLIKDGVVVDQVAGPNVNDLVTGATAKHPVLVT